MSKGFYIDAYFMKPSEITFKGQSKKITSAPDGRGGLEKADVTVNV